MTDLRVDERHADGVVADETAQPSPNVGQLHEQRLHDVVAADEPLLPRTVDDVGGPYQRHPVLGHGALAVHLLEHLALAF